MDITGKIIMAFPEISGESKAGKPWKKREYVLETMDSFPKKIFFDFFGEKADQYPLEIGQVIKLYFDINCREYNGRWFTSISGWKYENASENQPEASSEPQNPYGAPYIPPVEINPAGQEDDLPF